ncbi:hypothetical protein [Pseudomonas sp. NPDC089734]|uniref:hypothetical protein n=1 Tax=Pseudomonas sp. NPDC089734 TaxID=3364469 RepID=UPI003821EB8A
MQNSRSSYEHLSADEDAAAHYVQRRPSRLPTFYRNIVAVLIPVSLGAYGVFHYSGTERVFTGKTVYVQPQRQAPATMATASLPASEPQTAQPPKPLANCIGPDNLIDHSVATCRFGQFPQAFHNTHAQGMVSDQYMAQYRSDQQTSRSGHTKTQSVEWATVQQWDKRLHYRAVWNITDNRIEGSSVCTNWNKGSFEYRECRKGAKVYFRDQCKSWRKKWEKTQTDSSKAALQRYCSADNGFNPLG